MSTVINTFSKSIQGNGFVFEITVFEHVAHDRGKPFGDDAHFECYHLVVAKGPVGFGVGDASQTNHGDMRDFVEAQTDSQTNHGDMRDFVEAQTDRFWFATDSEIEGTIKEAEAYCHAWRAKEDSPIQKKLEGPGITDELWMTN